MKRKNNKKCKRKKYWNKKGIVNGIKFIVTSYNPIRAEEAAQLALTAPKEEQRRPNYYSHGHDTYNRGPTTPPHQFLSNNPRNNAGMGMHGNKPVNSQPFTGLVPPALQHLTAQQFHRRREPPLLKDPPHPFFGTGFIGGIYLHVTLNAAAY